MRNYLVIYEQGEDGAWGAWTPDIDGVVGLGRTRDEVEERMREALAAYVEYMTDEGLPIAEPRHHDMGVIAV